MYYILCFAVYIAYVEENKLCYVIMLLLCYLWVTQK